MRRAALILTLLLTLLSSAAFACSPKEYSRTELIRDMPVVVKGRLLQIASNTRDGFDTTVFRVERVLRGGIPVGDYELIDGNPCRLSSVAAAGGQALPDKATEKLLQQSIAANQVVFLEPAEAGDLSQERYLFALLRHDDKLVVPYAWGAGMVVQNNYVFDDLGFEADEAAFVAAVEHGYEPFSWVIPEDTPPEKRCLLESHQRRFQQGADLVPEQEERIVKACVFAAQAMRLPSNSNNALATCPANLYPQIETLLEQAPVVVHGSGISVRGDANQQFRVINTLRGGPFPAAHYSVIANCGGEWKPVSFNDDNRPLHRVEDGGRFLLAEEALGSVLVVPGNWATGLPVKNGKVSYERPCPGLPERNCQWQMDAQTLEYYILALGMRDAGTPSLTPPTWTLSGEGLAPFDLCQVEAALPQRSDESIQRCAALARAEALAKQTFSERLMHFRDVSLRTAAAHFTPVTALIFFVLGLVPILFIRGRLFLIAYVLFLTLGIFLLSVYAATVWWAGVSNWYDFAMIGYTAPVFGGMLVGYLVVRIWRLRKTWRFGFCEGLFLALCLILMALSMHLPFLAALGKYVGVR